MGSVSRRLTKHLSFFNRSMAQQIKGRRAGMSVIAAAAIIAPAVTEGVLLSQRLERAARENNATDPLHFLEYLRRMRRGYDPRVDGPSALMTLVDEIAKFEVEELARRKAAAGASAS
ncbi:MAG TPA: hypothetical protein VER96_33795 [Polyangiaceae bacterium]|nr:hypothetical protein [Polyangiaceae bacterium]